MCFSATASFPAGAFLLALGAVTLKSARQPVHDDNITTRGHHVSFVKTLGLGADSKSDIKAVKLP